MKTTILTPRTVEVSMTLSELLAGLNRHESEMYLCMVVHKMTADAMGINNTYIQVMDNGYEHYHCQFKGITDQMLSNFAPFLGVEYSGNKMYSSIQSWAKGTIYSKGVLLPFEKVQELTKEYKEIRDAYVVETVAYRRVLLEKLIYEKGDQSMSFVLKLDSGSPVSF